MATCLGKSCSFDLPRLSFVNCCQFMYLVVSLLVLRAGCGISLYRFLIIAYPFTLSDSKYFTALDMKSGYHQVQVAEEHKGRTAFTAGTLVFDEFKRLPFGLYNAPATYQRLMEQCLGDMNMKICCIYLDDLIIFSDTLEQHLDRFSKVLNILRECNLKLNPKKCKFLQRKNKIRWPYSLISGVGIEADPGKIEKVRNWPTQKTADEMRQFILFAGYIGDLLKVSPR